MLDFGRIFENALVESETGIILDEDLSGAESTRFRNLLKKNVVTFHYRKKDGTERTAHGTLEKSLMPKFRTERKPKYNPTRFVYWDTDRKQFRSFLRANFIDYEKPGKNGDAAGGKEEGGERP